MNVRTVENLGMTTNESDTLRFVRGFQSVANISGSGKRRHLLGVRITYLFEATRATGEGIEAIVLSMLTFLAAIRVSHKAYNNQWCSAETGVDLTYLNDLLGIGTPGYLQRSIVLKPGDTTVFGVSFILPWAPSAFGKAKRGIDPFDGAADLSMFGNSGEVLTQFSMPAAPDENTTFAFKRHSIDLEILESDDLYVFQPQSFRTIDSADDPVSLNGSYRKIQELWARAVPLPKTLEQPDLLAGRNISLRADGRIVYDGVPATSILQAQLNTDNDLRDTLALREVVERLLQECATGVFTCNTQQYPNVLPLVSRNHTLAQGQLGPAGSNFDLRGCVPAALGDNKAKPRYCEYSHEVRDFSQFAVQVALAGLDPKKWPNESIRAGSKPFSEIAASGDLAIGLGLRWPGVSSNNR